MSEKEEKKENELDEFGKQDEGEYGCGPIGGSAFGCLNNVGFFTVMLSIAVMLQAGITHGFIPISLSSIEKRFGFESWMTGTFFVFYEAAFISISLYVSYGCKVKVSTISGISMLTLGTGCLLFSLPHFLTPLYEYKESGNDSDLCLDQEQSCTENEGDNLSSWLAMFIFAQLLNGFGSVAYYTIGLSFIEDSCAPGKGALYFGIVRMFSAVGPIIGYAGGAVQLGTWVDFDQVDTEEITVEPKDPQWVGAWWAGIFVGSLMCLVCAFPMFGFPKQLPGVAEIKSQRKDESLNATAEENLSVWKGIKRLAKNPVFMYGAFGTAFDAYVKTGLMNYGPKIVETRFHLTASKAALLSGVVCVPGAILGSIFGGLVILLFKLSGRGIMVFSTISAILAAGFYTGSAFFSCGTVEMVGVTHEYAQTQPFIEKLPVISDVNLTSTCNQDCFCTQEFIKPVCMDGVTYFSPCHAGCVGSMVDANNATLYTDCACGAPSGNGQATEGECEKEPTWQDECDTQLTIMLVMSFFTVFFEFLTDTTVPIAILRAVDPSLKGLSMGVFWLVVKLFGSLPAPVISGAFLDLSCLIWQEVCDSTGFCWLYNDDTMFIGILAFPLATKLFSVLLYGLGALYFRPASQVSKTTADESSATTEDDQSQTDL